MWCVCLVILPIRGHIPYQGRHCFCPFVIHVSFCIKLVLILWFGEKRDGQPRSTSGDAPPHLHYRLFSLSLYLAVLHPGINHLFNPLIQPVQLLLLPQKYTTQSLYL